MAFQANNMPSAFASNLRSKSAGRLGSIKGTFCVYLTKLPKLVPYLRAPEAETLFVGRLGHYLGSQSHLRSEERRVGKEC